MDLGLAKRLTSDEQRALTVCGTPEYLAPEMLHGTGNDNEQSPPQALPSWAVASCGVVGRCWAGGAGYGKAVDVWSLGVLVFELVTLRTPFHDSSPLMVRQSPPHPLDTPHRTGG